MPTAPNSEGRQLRRAPNSEQRGTPNGAELRTARNSERRGTPNGAKRRRASECESAFALRAVRDLAPFGVWRLSEFGDFRSLATFGVWRRRHLSPSALRALRQFELWSRDRHRHTASSCIAVTELSCATGTPAIGRAAHRPAARVVHTCAELRKDQGARNAHRAVSVDRGPITQLPAVVLPPAIRDARARQRAVV